MQRVRAGCCVTTHLQSRLAFNTRGIWKRNYSTQAPEESDGLNRASYANELLKAYDSETPPPLDHKNPKIVVPIKPYQPKPTPESEPWLFLMGVFPKSIHDFNKEAEQKKLNPPGSEFHGVWLKNRDLEAAKRDRFSKELLSFRSTYEKPVLDAFREVDMQVQAEYTQKKFERRQKSRKQQKKNEKKVQPGSTLMRYMQEKEYWEKFASVIKLGDFGDLPPLEEASQLFGFEALKSEISTPAYDYELIKGDYGQKSDWTVASYLTSLLPEDELHHLSLAQLMPPKFVDQLYRSIKELEHVYAPLEPKIVAINRHQLEIVEDDKKQYLESKKQETPPDVWGEIFNPDYITEFDDIEDPDSVSLEELDYRLDKAYENWTKRLLDPEVEERVKHYVRNLTSGELWSKFSVGGNNRLHQFADQAIADQRIFLRDADVVRILKGQLVDAGLAKIVVKRKSVNANVTSVGETSGQGISAGTTASNQGVAQGNTGLAELDSANTSQFHRVGNQWIERSIPARREQSPILTDDRDAYYEFVPTYQDNGTKVLPPKPKKEKKLSKEGLESQFQAEVRKLDDRFADQRHLPIKKKELYWPAVENLIKFDNMDSEELAELYEAEEEELEAHQAHHKWRKLWPQPQTGTVDLEGKALEEFMRSDRWYPVNHLFYNHNVEFFTRTMPLSEDIKPADRARLRKVVMRVYVAPLELPAVVDKRLKQLLGPRYNQPAKVVTLTGSDRHKQSDNKAYLKLLFREILHEAWLADPNYVPTYPLEEEPSYSWKPSEAAAEVSKPVLFRLYGTSLQSHAESTQKRMTALEQVINNPQTFNYPPLTPAPSVYAEKRALAVQNSQQLAKEAAERKAENKALRAEQVRQEEERKANNPALAAKEAQFKENLKQVKEVTSKQTTKKKTTQAAAFYKSESNFKDSIPSLEEHEQVEKAKEK